VHDHDHDHEHEDASLVLLPDHALGELVRLADEVGLTLPVTLWVRGAVLSGTLVGAREHLARVREQTQRVPVPPALAPILDEVLVAVRDAYPDPRGAPADEPDDELEEGLPAYVHLADARYHLPGAPPIPSDGPGLWWRGRLASVDGFALGGLSASA
jgi:hypothetical protein